MKKGFDFFLTRLDSEPYDLSSIVELPVLYKLFVQCFEVNSRCLRVDKFMDHDGDIVSIGSIKFQLPEDSASIYLNNFLDHSDILRQWDISKGEIEWCEHRLLRIALLGQVGFGGLYLGCGEHNSDEIWIFNSDREQKFKKIDSNIFEFIKRLEFSTDLSNLDHDEYEDLYKNWREEFWRIREGLVILVYEGMV